MQKIAPRVSVVGWSLWLLMSLGFVFIFPSQTAGAQASFQTFIGLGVKGGGVAVSALLCQRPIQRLAFLLAGLCLFALWKFYFGEILFHMSSQLGGLSFTESVADWWHRSTGSLARFMIVIPFCAFVVASLIYWPFYALMYCRQTNETVG